MQTELSGGFPRNLSYLLRKLDGSIFKQKIVINGDKNEYKPNERVMVNFPMGRIIDSRSVVATAKFVAGTGLHAPRGGLSSLIENLQLTANSRVIQSTQNYNFIWNCYADCSGYFSPEQEGKRIYENFDPSIANTNEDGIAAPAITNNCAVVSGNETKYFCVNSWLGFLSSSASCFNLNDIGQLQMIITLAPNTAQWTGATTSASSALAASDYTISEFTLSMDTITFSNSLYHDLVKSQLEGNGLRIAYNDYLISSGRLETKSNTNFTHVAQFSTNSLDEVIATFRHENYNTIGPLLLGNATYSATSADIRGSTKILSEVVADPINNEANHGSFNNSIYFQRCGGGIKSSSWYVNSQPFTVNSTPIQIFNNTLQALDYANLDIASGGPHKNLTSGFYNKNFFVDILSLQNLSGDNNYWVSGYGANSGIHQIQYNYSFSGASVENKVYPVIIGKVSKIMNIKIGRNIDIEE
jgi:hypothetical protein